MSSLKISSLHPTGCELFDDSENFLTELDDSEFRNIKGGLITSSPVGLPSSIIILTIPSMLCLPNKAVISKDP